jgi:hypothetical protein
MAKVGPRRTGGGGGAATVEGRSGIVDGVNGGPIRGTSAPAWSITPDGGIDEVAVTGRAGTASGIAPGAPLPGCVLVAVSDLCKVSALRAASVDFSARVESLPAEVCVAGFAGFPDLSAASALCVSRDLSDEAAGFADLSPLCWGFSDLRSGFAALSGFCADCIGAGAAVSEAGAACAVAAQKAVAARAKYVSRKVFTDTDLSAAARRLHPSSTRKIEEKLRRVRSAIDDFRGKNGASGLARRVDSSGIV